MPADSPVDILRPSSLNSAGAAIWDALTAGNRTVAELALIAEVARITHRLRTLDEIVTDPKRDWARLIPARDDASEYVIRVDGALQEARQQAVVLKQLLSQLEIDPAAEEASSDDIDFGNLRVVGEPGTAS